MILILVILNTPACTCAPLLSSPLLSSPILSYPILSYPLLSFLQGLSKDVETYFPEIAGPIYLVNAPKFITRMWYVSCVILKLYITSTLRRSRFMGSNHTQLLCLTCSNI